MTGRRGPALGCNGGAAGCDVSWYAAKLQSETGGNRWNDDDGRGGVRLSAFDSFFSSQ